MNHFLRTEHENPLCPNYLSVKEKRLLFRFYCLFSFSTDTEANNCTEQVHSLETIFFTELDEEFPDFRDARISVTCLPLQPFLAQENPVDITEYTCMVKSTNHEAPYNTIFCTLLLLTLT